MAEASEGHAAFRESIVLNQEKSTVYNLRAQGRSVGDNKQTISEPDFKDQGVHRFGIQEETKHSKSK